MLYRLVVFRRRGLFGCLPCQQQKEEYSDMQSSSGVLLVFWMDVSKQHHWKRHFNELAWFFSCFSSSTQKAFFRGREEQVHNSLMSLCLNASLHVGIGTSEEALIILWPRWATGEEHGKWIQYIFICFCYALDVFCATNLCFYKKEIEQVL